MPKLDAQQSLRNRRAVTNMKIPSLTVFKRNKAIFPNSPLDHYYFINQQNILNERINEYKNKLSNKRKYF